LLFFAKTKRACRTRQHKNQACFAWNYLQYRQYTPRAADNSMQIKSGSWATATLSTGLCTYVRLSLDCVGYCCWLAAVQLSGLYLPRLTTYGCLLRLAWLLCVRQVLCWEGSSQQAVSPRWGSFTAGLHHWEKRPSCTTHGVDAESRKHFSPRGEVDRAADLPCLYPARI
jgi:hypothetical protein